MHLEGTVTEEPNYSSTPTPKESEATSNLNPPGAKRVLFPEPVNSEIAGECFRNDSFH